MKSRDSGICKVVDTQKMICPNKNVLVMIVMKNLLFSFVSVKECNMWIMDFIF